MARLNFTKITSGSSIIQQYMNYSWGNWRYTGDGSVNTWAHCNLTISSGGLASGSKLYPNTASSQIQMSAMGSLSTTFSDAYVIVSYKNLYKANSANPVSINSDLAASGFSGSYEFTIRCSDGKTLNQNYVYIWSAINNIKSTGTSYVTNTTKLSLPGGFGIPYGNPTGSTTLSNITQTTTTRRAVVGTWGNFCTSGTWSWNYGPGNYNYGSGGSTTATLSGLSAGTTYNYRFVITNNRSKSSTYTGSWTTPAWIPPSSSINSITETTPNSFRINYGTWGSDVSQVRVYVNGGHWTTLYSNPGYVYITGLSAKSTYSVYIQPYNSNAGWGSNSNTVYGTTYPNPVSVTNSWMSNELPFSATANASSSSVADTSGYRFELWNAGNTSQLQVRDYNASSTWNITGLIPETTYTLRTYVRTNTSGAISAVRTITFTTPADQASIWLKVAGVWRKGKVSIKNAGVWKQSKKIFIKVNGSWRGNVNN